MKTLNLNFLISFQQFLLLASEFVVEAEVLVWKRGSCLEDEAHKRSEDVEEERQQFEQGFHDIHQILFLVGHWWWLYEKHLPSRNNNSEVEQLKSYIWSQRDFEPMKE